MHLSFSEAKLEQAIIELLQDQGYQHLIGDNVPRSSLDQVIIEDDLRHTSPPAIRPTASPKRDPAADQTVHHPARLRSLRKQ
jgi:hypothetical protein